MHKKLGIIGAGNMGEAILRGLHQKGLTEGILVSELCPAHRKHVASAYGVKVVEDNKGLASEAEVIVIAVKPQEIASVLEEISPYLRQETIIISIAAGVSLGTIASILGSKARLIRVMPNIAALALESATALARGENATDEDLRVAQEIFSNMGKTVVIPEYLMDAVTGMSGSGPAYVALFIEALADGGVRMGLPRKEALDLAIQTVLGTAKLLADTGEHPANLKDMVASPGGTTIAGIAALEARGFRGMVIEAVAAATQRAKELAKQK